MSISRKKVTKGSQQSQDNFGCRSEEPGMLRECSICGGPFDLDKEGGSEGNIGILPVAFCPTCRVGILDFADQQMPGFDCPHCGEYIDRE
jgi:hypothetical protein